MDLTGKIVARGPEAFTVRELREMTESRAWQIYQGKLMQLLAAARVACETERNVDELRKAQGSAETLRRVQQLPQILEQELANAPK